MHDLEKGSEGVGARGYDAVSVANLTEALGINPPSFYAAFGSKAGLYARTLRRYTNAEGIPIAEILRPGRIVAEALAAVLEESARRYGADLVVAGCLAIKGPRCNDPEAREAARVLFVRKILKEIYYKGNVAVRPC